MLASPCQSGTVAEGAPAPMPSIGCGVRSSAATRQPVRRPRACHWAARPTVSREAAGLAPGRD